MAQTRSRPRSGARGRSGRATSGRGRTGTAGRAGAGASRPRGTARKPAPPKRRRLLRKAGAGVARHIGSRSAEAVGIGLMIFALLGVMGLWFHAAGPFGRALKVGARASIGPMAYGIPVLAGYWSLLLMRGASPEERGRRIVGFGLA